MSSPTASHAELSGMTATARGDRASRWIVVVAAIAIVGFGVGALFSLAVFLRPMQESMAWSRAAISAVALWMWVAYGTGSLMWGVVSDRWGVRRVVVAGGLLLGLGLVASSRITSLWQLYLAFGGVVGVAAGAFYAPLTTTVTRRFTANRGLAVALVSAGTGLGTFMVAPLTRWLISSYDWRLAMLILGDIVWLVIIPLGLLIRDAPGEAASATDPDVPLGGIFRSAQFWLIALTHFTCCVAHSGPIFHMVTHAMDQGVPSMAAATLLGVSGLASLVGRVVSGLMADRWGSKPTLIAMLGLQAPAIFLYLFTSSVAGFYALAILFGVSYGGVMPMYALLTREYFGARAMGTAYGAIFMLQAIGMGLGAYGGGWFHDHLGTYAWLFGFATAAAALAILFALPLRPSRRRLAPAPAVA
ncbi:MAG TPA: MFS transporter [Candidatus Methylomirabilis sp.]|nr:MFS transporter [Candidatus Methylomirabilis sp.]